MTCSDNCYLTDSDTKVLYGLCKSVARPCLNGTSQWLFELTAQLE